MPSFSILDPPEHIVLQRKLDGAKTRSNHSVITCYCDVSLSYPACTISWESSGGIVQENRTNVRGDMTNGFETRSFITVDFKRSKQKQYVTCHAHCGRFYKSDTLQVSFDNIFYEGKFNCECTFP